MAEEKHEISFSVSEQKGTLKGDPAKVFSRMIGRPVDAIYDLTGTVFGGLIGDRLKVWRLQNLANLLNDATIKLQKKNIDLDTIRELPNAEMFHLVDAGSQEDDPDLRDLWAGLLSNSLDPNGEQFEKVYVKIVEQLRSIDARVFTFIARTKHFENEHVNNLSKEEIDEYRNAQFNLLIRDTQMTNEACNRLKRLGLIMEEPNIRAGFSGQSIVIGEEGSSDLADIHNRLIEAETQQTSTKLLNQLYLKGKESNFLPTNFGWDLARVCILT